MRRVAVTGLGVVAPNGVGKEAFWSSCVEGRSGVGPIRSFDPSGHPVRIAAEVPDFDMNPFLPGAHRKSLKIMGRAARFAVAAASLGVHDSGLDWAKINPERVGVVMGAGVIPMDLPDVAPVLAEACNGDGRFHVERLGQRGPQSMFPLWLLKYLPNMTAEQIGLPWVILNDVMPQDYAPAVKYQTPYHWAAAYGLVVLMLVVTSLFPSPEPEQAVQETPTEPGPSYYEDKTEAIMMPLGDGNKRRG